MTGIDGDTSHRTLKAGAQSATNETEFTSGLHEEAKPRMEPAGEKTTGTGTPLLSSEGAIGKQFKADGAIGSIGQAVGGPLAADGAIGKNFTAGGSIGGAINEQLGKGESNSVRK